MSSAIKLREDFSAVELRRLAKRAKDANQIRRLLSLAAVREGKDREEAARIGGMDRQTLRDWVHRFNAEGADGLIDRQYEGPKVRLTPVQLAELSRIVETGPDPKADKVVRWRRLDLRDVIAARFGVEYHERYVGKLLKKLGFSHVSARPRHPGQDARIVEEYKNVWPAPSARASFESADDQSAATYPASEGYSQPRWRCARSGPHKLPGVERRFLNQVSRAPFDCQAISSSPLANLIDRSARSGADRSTATPPKAFP